MSGSPAPRTPPPSASPRARFAVYGDRVYPDATGTLRITYGRIEGWKTTAGG
jgi:hypothetical protein